MAESKKSAILSSHKMAWGHHPSQIGNGGCQKNCHRNPPW